LVLRMKQDLPGAVRAVRRAIAADAYLRDVPRSINRLIFAYLFAGQGDSARTLCLENVPRYPRDPAISTCELNVLGWAGAGAQDVARARKLARDVERVGPWPLAAGISPEARYYVAAVLARSGFADSARAMADSTRRLLNAGGYVSAYLQNEAYVRVLLDEHERALDALERDVKAVPEHADQIARLPWFTPLHDNPRYRALIARH
jgi:hypothetical protein